MLIDRILWITLVVAFVILFATHYLTLQTPIFPIVGSSGQPQTQNSVPSSKSDHLLQSRLNTNSESISKLIDLIRIQNETIVTLEKKLEKTQLKLTSTSTYQPPSLPSSLASSPTSSSLSTSHAIEEEFPPVTSRFRQECLNRYGMDLASIWKKNEEIWCEDSTHQSYLKCYPYHQAHKKLDGRGPDLFCEATNFLIDFSKVAGVHGQHKFHLGDQYLGFMPGSLSSPCRKTNQYKERLFMPHHSMQMRSFQEGSPYPNDYETVNTVTYLLARDEDCENAFHSTADFMNMFLVKSILNLPVEDMQVMLFDKHPDGPFMDLIQKAYSPHHPVIRHQHYKGKKVLFKRLVFHLESPAGLIFPKVARPDPLRCYDMTLFQEYRKFILKSFNLLDIEPPPIPEVTLILRHRTEHKNVGRVMANEKEVVEVLKRGNMMRLNVIDLAKMSFTEQLTLIRKSNVLVGIHGAGLMFIMFAAEEAVLVEIHPSYRQDRHFRHASRMTGKIYMPMRTTRRETCHGTSDNVFVEIEEFQRAMDGALRVARNFDDGLSECGLICPKSILAIDGRLDPYYSMVDRKGGSLDLNFPCG